MQLTLEIQVSSIQTKCGLDVAIEAVVRAFFCLIQTAMVLLYEGGVSPV